MPLIFLGRLSREKDKIDKEGKKVGTYRSQQFRSGFLKIVDRKPALDKAGKKVLKNGKPILEKGQHMLTPVDIGKQAKIYDEDYVLSLYPNYFKKA